MLTLHTTLSKYLIEAKRNDGGEPDQDLIALLNDVQTACKAIAHAVGRGRLEPSVQKPPPASVNIQGEEQKPLDVISNAIMIKSCEWGGQLAGMASEEMAEPYRIPDAFPRGRYLLLFDPLDGSSNLDVNTAVGTIFSVLRAPDGNDHPRPDDFLQQGTRQVAAGYALYGPASMLVITLGAGVVGFTHDSDIGAFVLTHPDMRVSETTREFAINASNHRFWEAPVRRYVDECIKGRTGPRHADFNMRWIASMVAEVHRILIRGGLFMYPRDSKDPARPGRLRLMYEANPMAMIIEQAGGAASTGRTRLLEIEPTDLHQRVPVILGSRLEVDRLVDYHEAYDRGEFGLDTPLFNTRSLFRTA